MRKLCFL